MIKIEFKFTSNENKLMYWVVILKANVGEYNNDRRHQSPVNRLCVQAQIELLQRSIRPDLKGQKVPSRFCWLIRQTSRRSKSHPFRSSQVLNQQVKNPLHLHHQAWPHTTITLRRIKKVIHLPQIRPPMEIFPQVALLHGNTFQRKNHRWGRRKHPIVRLQPNEEKLQLKVLRKGHCQERARLCLRKNIEFWG